MVIFHCFQAYTGQPTEFFQFKYHFMLGMQKLARSGGDWIIMAYIRKLWQTLLSCGRYQPVIANSN